MSPDQLRQIGQRIRTTGDGDQLTIWLYEECVRCHRAFVTIKELLEDGQAVGAYEAVVKAQEHRWEDGVTV